jgi:general secretion pathway protein G
MRQIRQIQRFREILAERAGFTLMELLVVMVILGLLAALVGPRIWKNITSSKQTTAKTQIALLGQALDQFRLDTGRYPSTQENLEALRTNPGLDGWDGPYLRKAVPMDPWKKPYSFQSPGSRRLPRRHRREQGRIELGIKLFPVFSLTS